MVLKCVLLTCFPKIDPEDFDDDDDDDDDNGHEDRVVA